MKSAHLCAGVLVGCAIASSAVAANVNIASPTNPTGTHATDFYKWKVVPVNTLTIDGAEPIANVLQGDASNPGGNVELFADSETPTYAGTTAGGAFQTAAGSNFSGTLQGLPIAVSSLNGNDWFNTPGPYDNTYAGSGTNNTLAQKWFNDFFAFYNFDGVLTTAGVAPGTIATERVSLFNLLRDTNGFQRISDPNVGYVNQDDVTNVVSIGLEGTQSYLKTNILGYIAATPNLTGPQKAAVGAAVNSMTIDASEVVEVTYNNGAPQFLYGFTATSVSLSTDDPTESYNQNFNLTFQGVPEPASLSVLGLAAILIGRRRRVA